MVSLIRCLVYNAYISARIIRTGTITTAKQLTNDIGTVDCD